jgi:hypothetical protein
VTRGPISAGDVLARTYATWRRHLAAFSIAVLAAHAPVIVLHVIVGGAETRSAAALSWLLGVLASGAITAGTFRSLRDEPVAASGILVDGLHRFGPVALVSIGAGLVILIGLVLLVVPGVIAAAALWLAVPALVAEPGLSASGALARSRALSKGHRGPLLVALLAVGAPIAVAVLAWAGLVEVLEGTVSAGALAALEEAFGAFAGGFLATAAAVAYELLREAKEGAQPAQVAAVFD